MFHSDPLDGMTVFAAVVDADSFTQAAKNLRASKAAVSTHVQKLEDRLGTRLLNRTTRKLSLTSEGRAFYEHCRRILDEAREAIDAVDNVNAEPRGKLRINAPMSFGVLHLGRAIGDFMKEHPNVEIDLVLNDRHIDIVEEGFDLAVRIADLPDSSLIARRLAPCRRVVLASPAYWKKHGKPTHPTQLLKHDALIYDYLSEPNTWHFNGPDGPITQTVRGRMRANNGEVLLEAAKCGLGVVMTPTFFCCDQIGNNELEIALSEYEAEPLSIYAVYPHRRHLTARVRTLVDFLVSRYGERPYWDEDITSA